MSEAECDVGKQDADEPVDHGGLQGRRRHQTQVKVEGDQGGEGGQEVHKGLLSGERD